MTIVPGKLLPGGNDPDGFPPTPPPPPPTTSQLKLFVCNQISMDTGHYMLGYVTTRPQFCQDLGGVPGPKPDLTNAASLAVDTGKKIPANMPWRTDLHMFRCRFFNPSDAIYGVGLLIAHPQFCPQTSMPFPPGTSAFAVPINWNVENLPVFRCELATQDLGDFYGVGIVTTHAQFCDHLAAIAPRMVPAVVATDTQLTVP